ncbi:similar to Saccharomyces cerevisiae YGR201C Putative protein of unknown function [Maudiozyma barnettii]|uniref:GST C-terminal domain-containing protein n=1 Tax=Maudiozyma barnettii TaxID=61262 RepID=A0A8H2VGG8_9SACH|nr:uncharacterized protein KABA2_06S00110 [Kazachstania barnettii]CAB4255206.1 similar to Saccharomyces cerevisiae YGR201C Putative protein of unknown function [Kazachstania barnettii]CAD1783614.1 similar to Saccharomyces cerevisiae YGR201C Putative protein of unknown function [Kazachstania barnettii]
MTAILYTHNEFIRGIVAECLVNYFKLDIKIIEITQDVDAFLKNFPLKAIPGLITSDGSKYHEQIAVNNYIIHLTGNKEEIAKLLSTCDNYQEQSAILQICSFVTSDFLNTLVLCGLKDVKGVPISTETEKNAGETLEIMYKLFEEKLVKHKFLVNDSITVADLVAAASFSFGFLTFLDAEWRKKHPLISQWFHNVAGSKYMEYRFKDFKFIDKAIKVSSTPLPWYPKN